MDNGDTFFIFILFLAVSESKEDQSPPALKSLFNPNNLQLETSERSNFLNIIDCNVNNTDKAEVNNTERRKFRSLPNQHMGLQSSNNSDMVSVSTVSQNINKRAIFREQHYWPHQLCKKFAKETIFDIWRNEKYFLVLLIYQLFGYYLGKIQLKSL